MLDRVCGRCTASIALVASASARSIAYQHHLEPGIDSRVGGRSHRRATNQRVPGRVECRRTSATFSRRDPSQGCRMSRMRSRSSRARPFPTSVSRRSRSRFVTSACRHDLSVGRSVLHSHRSSDCRRSLLVAKLSTDRTAASMSSQPPAGPLQGSMNSHHACAGAGSRAATARARRHTEMRRITILLT